MKAYGGGGGIAPPFLTSALDGGEWSASLPCRFTRGERAPGTAWIGDRVDPRAGLDAAENRIILHCRELNPGRPARRYTELCCGEHAGLTRLKSESDGENYVKRSFRICTLQKYY
jgi:hypothetical protein